MKRLLLALALLALVGVGAAALTARWAWRAINAPYRGYPGDELILEIPPGTSTREIVVRLTAEGVIADERLARIYLRLEESPTLQAGEYRFSHPLTIPEVFDTLRRGDVVLHQVTLIEGLTLEEEAAALAHAGFGREEVFLEEMRRPDRILDLDADAVDLEGYLFPDSYRFPRGASERTIVDTVIATFRHRYADAVTARTGTEELPSVRETVTLASIVEKEAQVDGERPVIAGVYTNRLQQGIALYADPTIIFALKLAGTWDGNLRRPDLAFDSPYNTYVYPGLPPGPICSPGAASLAAALSPADVEYLYFVSRNDGTHVFSKTLAEHNRNVSTWQKRYWRKRWAKEREDRSR